MLDGDGVGGCAVAKSGCLLPAMSLWQSLPRRFDLARAAAIAARAEAISAWQTHIDAQDAGIPVVILSTPRGDDWIYRMWSEAVYDGYEPGAVATGRLVDFSTNIKVTDRTFIVEAGDAVRRD